VVASGACFSCTKATGGRGASGHLPPDASGGEKHALEPLCCALNAGGYSTPARPVTFCQGVNAGRSLFNVRSSVYACGN
jgi:hypothetical protein